jgi:metal-responsive CopG/Arc/MetJ family transcriptional regulator
MPKRGRVDWVYVGLPREIVYRIDKVIDTRQWGFKSRSDYILEAVKMDLRTRGYYP